MKFVIFILQKNSGRFLDAPHIITDAFDFFRFLASFVEHDILSWALVKRPKSKWVFDLVTNVILYVNLIPDHTVGCPEVTLPDYVRNNPSLYYLVRNRSQKHVPLYTDNVCFFRALALIRGANMYNLEPHVEALYKMYKESTPDAPPMNEFTGYTTSKKYFALI